jgi:hypothetical protein
MCDTEKNGPDELFELVSHVLRGWGKATVFLGRDVRLRGIRFVDDDCVEFTVVGGAVEVRRVMRLSQWEPMFDEDHGSDMHFLADELLYNWLLE